MKHPFPAAALVAALALAGCDSGPDSGAYERVEKGMSRDQVHELLGAPREVVRGTDEGSFTELWHQGDETVAVQYENGKVTIKSVEQIGSGHPATAQPPLDAGDGADANLEEHTERPSGTPPRREAPEAGDGRKDDERPAAEFP